MQPTSNRLASSRIATLVERAALLMRPTILGGCRGCRLSRRPLHPRVQRVAEAIPQKVEREHQQGQRRGRQQHLVRVGMDRLGASEIIAPQEGVGASTPRPMKERNTSVETYPGMLKVTTRGWALMMLAGWAHDDMHIPGADHREA